MSNSISSDVIYLPRVLSASTLRDFHIISTFLVKDFILYLDEYLEDHYMPDKFGAVDRRLKVTEICTSSPIIF